MDRGIVRVLRVYGGPRGLWCFETRFFLSAFDTSSFVGKATSLCEPFTFLEKKIFAQ